jgi:N-acetylneuraminic acid mutarotase
MSTTGAPAASNQGASVWSGTELLLWGGTGQGNAVDGGRYNPVTDSWAGLSGVGEPTARTNESVVWTGSEMILWGGVSGSSTFLNSMARYSPSSDSWLAIGAPSPRIGHTAVWTGSEMIVWGGRGITSYLNNGSRYDPATDDWTATTLTGAPWVRRGHAAVWTGSEMVVWGGYYGDAFSTWFLNTGARYNPMTDTWVPTTTVDAPDARSTPAIWTGHEMIVWGGSAGTSYLNTGGRYDPVTDHWIPTSTIGAPSPRGSFGAGWTGREMLVWGGWADLPGRVYYGSGGRYDPSTDSWTATSMAGAPVPRGEFAMVWDGHEAIVWGGEDDVTYFLATGGRYDPSTDSWTATPTLGAPAARLGPASLWTGSEMIVWGGSGTGMVDLNSGGRYNPNADQWMSTSMIGAPSARSELTAVWTGREMLVWGGHNYSTGPTFDTGGRYCAATCAVPATWFQDDDGDGVGTTAVQQLACDQPFGFAATAGDCDDANAAAYPGAAEINDSLDNQCPGDPGYGVVDEISGMCGFTDPGDRGAFCWVPQSGAVSYDVDRSTSPSFSSGCTTSNTTASCWSPADDPAPGVAQFLIVRASAPHVGSWGQDSTGVERHPICP